MLHDFVIMYLSQNVKFLRKRRGLNQTALGEKLGITKGAVSGYESGASLPGVETLVKIAQLLAVSIDDLVFRDIEKEGTSGAPAPQSIDPAEQTFKRLNELLEARVKTLEREIRKNNPDLADELGIG